MKGEIKRNGLLTFFIGELVLRKGGTGRHSARRKKKIRSRFEVKYDLKKKRVQMPHIPLDGESGKSLHIMGRLMLWRKKGMVGLDTHHQPQPKKKEGKKEELRREKRDRPRGGRPRRICFSRIRRARMFQASRKKNFSRADVASAEGPFCSLTAKKKRTQTSFLVKRKKEKGKPPRSPAVITKSKIPLRCPKRRIITRRLDSS